MLNMSYQPLENLTYYKESQYFHTKTMENKGIIELHCLKGNLIFFKSQDFRLFYIQWDILTKYYVNKYKELENYLNSEDKEALHLGLRLLTIKLKKEKLKYLKKLKNENSF